MTSWQFSTFHAALFVGAVREGQGQSRGDLGAYERIHTTPLHDTLFQQAIVQPPCALSNMVQELAIVNNHILDIMLPMFTLDAGGILLQTLEALRLREAAFDAGDCAPGHCVSF